MHILENLNYPLNFTFKPLTLASDFNITDANEQFIGYARQKLLKIKEDVVIFDSPQKNKELFRIKADRWLDFNANYNISTSGESLGKIARKGMKSIWKATYNILDNNGNSKYTISEENAWVKILDSFIGELPIIGAFTGYFLNPTYILKNQQGEILFKLKKQPSFFGRRFQLHKIKEIEDKDETLIVLSFMMMTLLERARG